ncbi:MAG: chorismate synthase [Planctomycetes bacterium]|nr:chorismate synthase [Planctomycetota bacterium]
MASNSFGDLFRITTFGESHGPALGVVIDGCPAGVALDEAGFLPELARRRPGQSAVTTARRESDTPVILSGVFEGRTTGMPIAVTVRNEGQRSQDYEALRHSPRPGHADETYAAKYGHRDHRGGGRSSGRETVARVLAGVVARKLLPAEVRIIGHALQIGPHRAATFDAAQIEQNPVRCADAEVAAAMVDYVTRLRDEHDSSGGLIEIIVQNPPPRLGEPVFDKLKARLAGAIMSVGAVTGFAYGAGFATAAMRGRDYVTDRGNFGGILGGISSGEDLRLLASVKPSTSIGAVAAAGRHDPCIVPRVIPVLEAMVAIALADALLIARSAERPA